jgi:hypothetical protein
MFLLFDCMKTKNENLIWVLGFERHLCVCFVFHLNFFVKIYVVFFLIYVCVFLGVLIQKKPITRWEIMSRHGGGFHCCLSTQVD